MDRKAASSKGSAEPGPYLLAILNENYAQARQHENLRQQSTTLLLSLAGALISLTAATLPLALKDLKGVAALSALGFYGLVGLIIIAVSHFGRRLSFKHYERNRFHVWRAREIRRELDRKAGVNVSALHSVSANKHVQAMLESHPRDGADIVNVRTYDLWRDIFVFVGIVGALIAAMAIVSSLYVASVMRAARPALPFDFAL